MSSAPGYFRAGTSGPARAILLFVFCLFVLTAWAKPVPAPVHEQPPAILPTEFAGWQQSPGNHASDDPQVADASNAGVLAEYGFRGFESAVYTTPGNKVSLRAIRFQDASGAYGAFTFYRRPGSLSEQIGRAATWDGSHVLFWSGNTLVDANFDHLTAMSNAELRELANELPEPAGAAKIAPTLPEHLPRTDLAEGLTRYTLGPESYVRSGGVLPPSLVGFASSSAEAVTANYSSHDGEGQLTLLEYPTPQLAAARLRDIDGFLKAGNTPQTAWPQALAGSHPDALLTRRTGPIIVVTSGSFSPATARKLLESVNYAADITWNNPQGYVGEGAKVARLLLGIFAFIAIVGGAAVLFGLFFGGGRALIRVLRGKPASGMNEETEFIRLNLDD